MKKVRVEEAVGMTLCHDITKVVPGVFKGCAFKRNHVIVAEDVEALLTIGKEHIYVWEAHKNEVHEEEAAVRIAQAVSGANISYEAPREGKSVLNADCKGLFTVNSGLLRQINRMEHVTVPCLPNHYRVEKGQKLSGCRVIPLVVEEACITELEALCREQGPVFEVKPYRPLRAGIVTTGGEVFRGRVEDRFGPIIQQKLDYFGADVLGQRFCPDELPAIEAAVRSFQEQQADVILLTGGMSVDPDDLTPGAIRSVGAEVVTYGVPIQPGNMFMLGYLGNTALLGVPGAALFYKTTILDVVLPRVFAGERMSKDDFAQMGEGGFCMACPTCHYPVCYFGR